MLATELGSEPLLLFTAASLVPTAISVSLRTSLGANLNRVQKKRVVGLGTSA